MKRQQAVTLDVSNKANWLMPRERANAMGVDRLSDLDLMQVIIGSGTRSKPVRQLANEVLSLLEKRSACPALSELREIEGIGEAKSTLISSAFELARRLYLPPRKRIQTPVDTLPILRHWADRRQEYFLSIGLNGAHEIIYCRVVSVGTVNRTLVHPREVFCEAISETAAGLIVAHNHPSGNVEPSSDDIDVTNRLKLAGETIGIPLLDHIIFSAETHVSLLERGLL